MAAALAVLAVARSAVCQRHPVRALLGSVAGGLAALGAVAALYPLTGVALQLNGFTCFTATVLGLPGVISMLLLKILL